MLILDIIFIDGFMSCVEKRRTKLIKFHFIIVETVHSIATNLFKNKNCPLYCFKNACLNGISGSKKTKTELGGGHKHSDIYYS